jgi:hypothetical protein
MNVDRDEQLHGLAVIRAFTIARYVADKWAHIGGFPRHLEDLEPIKETIRRERAEASGLILPKGPNR